MNVIGHIHLNEDANLHLLNKWRQITEYSTNRFAPPLRSRNRK